MTTSRFKDVEKANRALLANRSPRYERLNRLEQYVDTTQYDDRQFDWFDDSEDAPPLRERRPCIAYPIVQAAIDSNVDLCLGEGKFPAICLTDGDDAEEEASAALSETERQTADAGITKLVEASKLKRVFRRAMALAQGCGTTVVIVGVRGGKPFAEVEQAKRCTCERDKKTGAVKSLEIRYPYQVEVRDERDGCWRLETRLYRRVIDEQRDVTYLPQEAIEDGREPKTWKEDPELTAEHGLGFCPVVWYAHMVASTTAEQSDGRAIHARVLGEIEALDVALSQWHRAAFYSGDPQGYEAGVDSQGAFGDAARTHDPNRIWSTRGPGSGGMSDKNPVIGEYVPAIASAQKPARKKGPGVWWSYPNAEVKVGLLTLPGDALKCIEENARDIRDKVAESLGVVFSDPEMVRFASALSGKAQQMLRQRQLDRCDQYRDDMDDGLIVPTVHLLLRVCRKVAVKSKAIRKTIAILSRLGDEPSLSLRWGAYYAPDPEEEKKQAEFLTTADKAIPLPLKTKVQKLARALGVENVDAFLTEVEAEQTKREEKAAEVANAHANALRDAVDAPAIRGRAAKAAEPDAKADPPGRSGTAPAPAKDGAKPAQPGPRSGGSRAER